MSTSQHTVTIPTSLTPIEFNNHKQMTFIAGPCVIESRDHALEMACALKEIGQRNNVNIIYKSSFDKANRSSSKSFRGLGLDESLKILHDVKAQTGLALTTDVHHAQQCDQVAQVVDILQIPAFLCRQTDLLLAAAATGKAVNIKKGQFLAPWDMQNVINKMVAAGNNNIMVCERGVSFGYNTLVSDMRALPIMAGMGFPVIFDATHSVQQPGGKGDVSGGERQYVETLARAAVSIGVAGVFIETHQDPDKAPSDGPNMIALKDLEPLIQRLLSFDKLAKSYV